MAVDKSETRVRKMFGEIAPRYDFLNHVLSLNIDKYWRRKTVRRAPPLGDAPLLDLCTGTGDLALAYARRTQAAIVAADFCPEMLTIGRQKAAQAGLAEQITFVEADAQRLPFPDNHFQIVAVAFGLRNVTDTEQGLREMVRVCRPGGKVVVLEFSAPRRWPLRGLYRWYFRRVLPRVGQALSPNGSSAYAYLPESVGEFPTYEALAARMQSCGLDDVEFIPLTCGIATLYVGAKPAASGAARAERVSDFEPASVPEVALR
jgi:demethylmenaquinone methyltransferase/2-methoxy-6-polyprenyl-1,4-benzoquinol methylase